MRTSRVLAFVCIVIVIGGCTKTVQHRVAGYYPGTAPTTQPVPKTAVYSIRFLDEKGKKTGGIPSSHRLLAAGEHAGFALDQDQRLLAVAGNNSFPIQIPEGYGAVWSTTYTKETQFSKEMKKAVRTTGKVAGLVAKGIVEGVLNGDDDDDCDFGGSNPDLDRIYKHRESSRRQAEIMNHH